MPFARDPAHFALGAAAIFVLGFLLNWFSVQLRAILCRALGNKGFLWLFWPGIVIHELSHMTAAVVFLHRVVDAKLIDLTAADGAHGYVKLQRRDVPRFLYLLPIWQLMGDLFIGIAPLILAPLLLVACLQYVVPGGSAFLRDPSLQALPGATPQLGGWLYLAVATLANVELSSADLKGAWKGFLFTGLLVTCGAIIYTGSRYSSWSQLGSLVPAHLRAWF